MVPTFSPDPKRDAAAALLAERATTWLRITLRTAYGAFPAGTRFYGVPSSTPGSFYFTNLQACSCPDYQRRGSGCKHQRAVALHVSRVRAEQARTAVQIPGARHAETDSPTCWRTCRRCQTALIPPGERHCDACAERIAALSREYAALFAAD